MIDDAVEQGLSEDQQLDWKRRLPEGSLGRSDLPKDLAAMANASGGLIVYGVTEDGSAANGREDVALTEGLEKQIRAAAASAIMPPLLGLEVEQVGTQPQRAIAVQVPLSEDAPHLIIRGDRFGAPVRNGADTRWMTEREIEQAYRSRFENRRRGAQDLDDLYTVAAETLDTHDAWLVAVARPERRTLDGTKRMTAEDAMEWAGAAEAHYRARGFFVLNRVLHNQLVEIVGEVRPRPGLRSQIFAVENGNGLGLRVSIHDSGAVTLATQLGSQCIAKRSDGAVWSDPEDVFASQLEAAAATLAALVEAQAVKRRWPTTALDLKVGVEWDGPQPLQIFDSRPQDKPHNGAGSELPRYRPVSATWLLDAEGRLPHEHVIDLALDLLNQAGIRSVTYLLDK